MVCGVGRHVAHPAVGENGRYQQPLGLALLEPALVRVELEVRDPGVFPAAPGRSANQPGQQDVGFPRAGPGSGVVQPSGGFEVEQAVARIGAIDPAPAGGFGQRFEIRRGIASK